MRYFQSAMALMAGLLALLLLPSCTQIGPSGKSGVVMLDIGHFSEAQGARTPSAVGGRVMTEFAFWTKYAPYTRRVIERAGYPCVITNRGRAPRDPELAALSRRARVIHLRKPDKEGRRYPSHYFPDRVASGIVSADYAIYRKSPCMVFLHHNSNSRRWKRGASPSVVLHNRYNGKGLATAIARRLEGEVLNHGMPNGGRGCSTATRYVDADRGAGWLNVCDDAGIPAAILEAAFLNNRGHANYLANEANARRYAEAVGRGIVDYLRSRKPPRHRRADDDVADEGSFGYAAESRRLDVPGAKRLLH